jgi:apolipoprotein D and lipocalin family protein
MKVLKSVFVLITTSFVLLLFTAGTIPKGAVAVKPFDVNKYLGHWYEIARLDIKQERGLDNTTAHYSLKDNGMIKVVNKGFNAEKGEWKEAEAKAKFADDPNVGMLKVSFFGPFYSGYNVIALDNQYRYALVAGENLKYLWILSRETTIPDGIKAEYLKKAQEIGYKTDELIWVKHDKSK